MRKLPLSIEDVRDEPFGQALLGLLTVPIDRRVLVIDDVDLYEDLQHEAVPSPPIEQGLPERLRRWAQNNGSTVVVTRPTAENRNQSRHGVPHDWFRVADVLVRLDNSDTKNRRASEAVSEDGLAHISVVKNRRGPRAEVELSFAANQFYGLVRADR